MAICCILTLFGWIPVSNISLDVVERSNGAVTLYWSDESKPAILLFFLWLSNSCIDIFNIGYSLRIFHNFKNPPQNEQAVHDEAMGKYPPTANNLLPADKAPLSTNVPAVDNRPTVNNV
ncbi:hypothetical protein BGW37DRAFT_207920 [Umbelopsis sp. PMI_123]|nr:hypothetical protein BGW37DRAFT_207920 [Umbelopsis sp. PMI_123]